MTDQTETQPIRQGILDAVTNHVLSTGASVPLLILHDFRSEADYRGILPDAPISVHEFRHNLGNDLLLMQLQGIPTATAVLDLNGFNQWADDKVIANPDRMARDYARFLVDNESLDVVFTGGYPGPRVLAGAGPEGDAWVAHIRQPFALGEVHFGTMVSAGTGRREAWLRYNELSKEGSLLPEDAEQWMFSAAEQALGKEELYDRKVNSRADTTPPKFLLMQSVGDDVRYVAVVHTAEPRAIIRLRADIPAPISADWVDEPASRDARVAIIRQAIEFVTEGVAPTAEPPQLSIVN